MPSSDHLPPESSPKISTGVSPEKVLADFYKSVADAQSVMHGEFRRIQSLAPAVNKARMFQLANILEGIADGRRHEAGEIRKEARWLRTVAETLK